MIPPTTGAEPTNWELDRRFGRLEQSIEKGFSRIDARLDKVVTTEVFTIAQQHTENRMSQLGKEVAHVEQRCDDQSNRLQDEIGRVEEARAQDRRNIIRVAAGAGVSILVALAGYAYDALGGALGV